MRTKLKAFASIFFLIPMTSFAIVYNTSNQMTPVYSDKSLIVLTSLWNQLGHLDEQIPTRKPDPVPAPDPVPVPVPDTDPAPVPEPTPAPTPSQGESRVQKMLRENREKLKKHFKNKKAQRKRVSKLTGLDRLKHDANQGLNELKLKNKQSLNKWKKLQAETLRKWSESKKSFHKKLPEIKKTTFEFESSYFAESSKKIKRPISFDKIKENNESYYVINRSLDIPIKEQGKRPTCAAFAGVRAMETIFWANNVEVDLSEQFFYWAAKPECQSSPCRKRGSWVKEGLEFGKVPSEEKCPYVKSTKSHNETQTPLSNQCLFGKASAPEYQTLNSIEQMKNSVYSQRPVVVGVKLTPNFYKNEGLVTYKDSFKSGKTDSHSKGHAILIVGVMDLPSKLNEGKSCFIAANSWGEGWGVGGHSCLTEKWLEKNLIDRALLSVTSVSM
jgi:C1A family cysteine protease